MSSILLRPMLVAWWRVTLVLRHVVALLRVRRVRRIRRTRSGNRWIYRNVRVRLYMWCRMMVILVSILQGHGRTCCLSHTDCTGVPFLLLRVVVAQRIQNSGWLHALKMDGRRSRTQKWRQWRTVLVVPLAELTVQQTMNLATTLRIESRWTTLQRGRVCEPDSVYLSDANLPINRRCRRCHVSWCVADGRVGEELTSITGVLPFRHNRVVSLVADSILACNGRCFGKRSKLTRQH